MALATLEPNCEERKRSSSARKTSSRSSRARDPSRPKSSSRARERGGSHFDPGTNDDSRDPTNHAEAKHSGMKELPQRSSSLKQARRNEPKTRDGVVQSESVRVSRSDSTDSSLLSAIQVEASQGLPHVSRQNSEKQLLPWSLEDDTKTSHAGVGRTQSFRLSRRESSHRRLLENAKSESFRVSRKEAGLEAARQSPNTSSTPGDAYQKPRRESDGHKRRSSSKKKEPESPSQQTPPRSDEPHHHRRHRPHPSRTSTDTATETNDDNAVCTRRPRHTESNGEVTHGHRREGHTTRGHAKDSSGASHTSCKRQGSPESTTEGRPQKNKHSNRLGHEQTHSHPKRESSRSKLPGSPDKTVRPRRSQASLAGHLDNGARRPRRSARSSGVSMKSTRSTDKCDRRPKGARAPEKQLVPEPTPAAAHNGAGEQEALRIEKLHLKGGKDVLVAGYPQYSLAEFIETQQPGSIEAVNKTWRMIREISNYDEVAGVLVFTQ
jgi:hypothetical protein